MDTTLDGEHLPLSTIRSYALGVNCIEDSRQIADHLACCSECRTTFVQELQSTLGQVPQNSASDSTSGPDEDSGCAPPLDRTPLPGDSIDIVGYRDVRFLGKGGMGTVYSAIQEVTRRKVAIKIITEPGGNKSVSADRTARAMREARVLAKLSHPSIVSVLEVLMVRQLPALVMEHVAGVPLDEWIQSNRPDPIKAARIAIRVAEAIEHAHERGVLHCDLKPQNILVAVDDTHGGANAPAVKLIDFGLAKLWRDDLKITHPGDKAQASVRAQQAEDALVDELRIGLQEMSKQAFSNSPQENSQQRVALQGIANRWQVFAKRTGDSTKSRAIRAEAHLRLGTIHSMLGDQDTAKNELQEAEQLLIQLIPTDPNSVYRNLLAETYGELAKGAHQQGDIEGAIGYFRSALASLDSEPAPTRSIDWKRIELETDLRINFGTLLTLSKQFEPATEQLDLAKELLERAEVPADSQEDLLVQKCRTFIRIALNLQAQGQIQEAIQTLEQSSQEISQLNRLLQKSGLALEAYAMHQTVLGKYYRGVGNFELAKEHVTSAISAQRRLVAAAPSAPLLKSQLGINLGVLGVIESQRREMQPAIDATSESLAIHR